MNLLDANTIRNAYIWNEYERWSTRTPSNIVIDAPLLGESLLYNQKRTAKSEREEKTMGSRGLFNSLMPKIKKVIYNPPATIILWNDGTKSVAKTQNGEFYDAEKGLAMAFMRKFLNNKDYHKYLEEAQEYETQYVDS